MEYALIENGIVVNTIVADAEFASAIAADWDAVKPLQAGAGVGWGWNAANGFIAPPVPDPAPIPAPQACTAAQGERALFDLRGITGADVLVAIDKIPDADNRYRTRSAYQRATEWHRDSETTQALAAILSLSEVDMDELFTYAVTLRV